MGKDARAAALEAKGVFCIQIATVKTERGKHTFRGPITFKPTAQSVIKKILALLGSTTRRYDDPNKGYNVTISRTGTGLDSTYGMMETDSDPSRVPPEIIAKLKPFSELKDVPIYEERTMKAAYRGNEDDDEDDEVTKKWSRSTTASKKSKSDDEDDEDDDEEVTDLTAKG